MKRKLSHGALSLLLCLSFILGLATTALAAGTEMITVRVLYLVYNEQEYLSDMDTMFKIRQDISDYTSQLSSFVVTLQGQSGNTVEFTEFMPYNISEICTASYFPYMTEFAKVESFFTDVSSGNRYTIKSIPMPTGYELVQDEIKTSDNRNTIQIDILALVRPTGYITKLTPTPDQEPEPKPEPPQVVIEQPSSWATEQVNAAIAANLVPQQLQEKYTQATTRAEFCALAVALYESVKGEITERSTFTDTNDVNVQKMAAVGVVSGVGDNKFAPNTELTREQAATMLSRLANAIGKPLQQQPSMFSDSYSVSTWAADAVGQMQATGIMSGVGNNTFAPKNPYTREQSIITIMRLYDIVK